MNITSKIVALSSAVAFALQIALALLMFRYFSPEEVGMFSVISQIGFFWTTLALAQTPLRLLANHGVSVFEDALQAWFSSLQRFVWLMPTAALAVWWSGLSFVNGLLWALLLSLCQLTWMLAQSMRLRTSEIWVQVAVRTLPPLMALLVVFVAVLFQWKGPTLLSSALFGYALGAAWFFSSFLHHQKVLEQVTGLQKFKLDSLVKRLPEPTHQSTQVAQGDNRSSKLLMAHTLVDALLATMIVVAWQRLYGAEETGLMGATLKVMGFFPTLVHMSWAQVILAQPLHARTNPLWVGLFGFIGVAALGAICGIALLMGWLGEQWQGVWPYLLPLLLWQGCACLTAAFSHRPFETKNTRNYSFICIGVASLQGASLILPVLIYQQINSSNHIIIFSLSGALGSIFLFWWQRNLND
jgi:hypothetical protein